MIDHVWHRAKVARRVDAVLVATEDWRVARAVDAFGVTVVMTSASHATGTDRLAEVAAGLESELVVNVQGDEPLLAPEAIDAAVKLVDDHRDVMVGTLRRRID